MRHVGGVRRVVSHMHCSVVEVEKYLVVIHLVLCASSRCPQFKFGRGILTCGIRHGSGFCGVWSCIANSGQPSKRGPGGM